MDLNHIGLTAELVAELYKDHIVEIGNVEPSPQNAAASASSGVQSDVAVLVQYRGSEIPAANITFLKNLLNAAALRLKDIELVNISTKKYDTTAKSSRIVLMFGLSPRAIDLPIDFPMYQVQPFNGVTYLCAPSLEDLEHDKLSKSKLWVCLKRIFNL